MDNKRVGETTLHGLYMYEVHKNYWRKVNTGYTFPSYRVGHAAALLSCTPPVSDSAGKILGMQYMNFLLTKKLTLCLLSEVKSKTTGYIDSQEAQKVTKNTKRECVNTFLMFGGKNFVSQISDTWILDLSWRQMDFSQYHEGQTDRIRSNLQDLSLQRNSGPIDVAFYGEESNEGSYHSSIDKEEIMKHSVSAPEFDMREQLRGAVDGYDLDADEICKALLQMRKQRALADIQVLEERRRVNLYKEENEALKKKLVAIIDNEELLIKKHDGELNELREALVDSVNKCRHLENLNEEAYTLLMLQSANNYCNDNDNNNNEL